MIPGIDGKLRRAAAQQSDLRGGQTHLAEESGAYCSIELIVAHPPVAGPLRTDDSGTTGALSDFSRGA